MRFCIESGSGEDKSRTYSNRTHIQTICVFAAGCGEMEVMAEVDKGV